MRKGLAGQRLVAVFIAGVLLLDSGVQMSMIANQAIIFALVPAARNRINTLYMTGMFLAGSLGSAVAGAGWDAWGWDAVCALGGVFAAVSLAAHRFLPRHLPCDTASFLRTLRSQ